MKKTLSSRRPPQGEEPSRDESVLPSWCHPCSAARGPPFDLLLREGNRGRLRPRSRAVFRPLLAVGPFQPGGPSLSGGVPLLMPVPHGTQSKQSERAAGEPPATDITLKTPLCQGRKGALPGLTIFLQSRSPRARPIMSISAVATFVAKGILYWSQSLVM